MFFEQRHLGDIPREHVVRDQVAAVEGKEEFAQPGVRGFVERVENWVEEELAEVVDAVGDEGRDAEVVGSGLPLALVEVGELYAGEVEERVFVV